MCNDPLLVRGVTMESFDVDAAIAAGPTVTDLDRRAGCISVSGGGQTAFAMRI